jgi:hypothetical protein
VKKGTKALKREIASLERELSLEKEPVLWMGNHLFSVLQDCCIEVHQSL